MGVGSYQPLYGHRLIGLDNDVPVGAEDRLTSEVKACWATQNLDLRSKPF